MLSIYALFIYYHLLLPVVIGIAITCTMGKALSRINLSLFIILNSFWSYLIITTLLYLNLFYATEWLILLANHIVYLNTYLILANIIFI